jgi:hypothetical protein
MNRRPADASGGNSSADSKPLAFAKAEAYEAQLAMVKEWTERTGQTCSTAEIILEDRKDPMTQESFLRTEGIRMELDDVLDSEEMLAELPEWFTRLPRGESAGLY